VVETIRHFFGICGEGHPNVFYILGALPILVAVRYYSSRIFGGVTLVLKTSLKRLGSFFRLN